MTPVGYKKTVKTVYFTLRGTYNPNAGLLRPCSHERRRQRWTWD